MITWMLYAAVIGALVGIASLALERVRRRARGSRCGSSGLRR